MIYYLIIIKNINLPKSKECPCFNKMVLGIRGDIGRVLSISSAVRVLII